MHIIFFAEANLINGAENRLNRSNEMNVKRRLQEDSTYTCTDTAIAMQCLNKSIIQPTMHDTLFTNLNINHFASWISTKANTLRKPTPYLLYWHIQRQYTDPSRNPLSFVCFGVDLPNLLPLCAQRYTSTAGYNVNVGRFRWIIEIGPMACSADDGENSSQMTFPWFEIHSKLFPTHPLCARIG